jgi:hypothetical protein
MLTATIIPARLRPRRRSAASAVALCALGALAALATAASVPTAAAQTPPSVAIELARPTVGVDDEFDIYITVQHAQSLGGFQFTLALDEKYLQYVSAEVGGFLGSTGREVTVLGPVPDAGQVTLGAVSISTTGQRGPDGEGDLATVRLRARAEGQTALDLTEVLLVDTDDQQTRVDGVDGLVTIGATPPPTPVTPTATPGTLPPTATVTPAATVTQTPLPEGSHVYLPTLYRTR